MRTPKRSGNDSGDELRGHAKAKFETLRQIEINSAISRQRDVDRDARD